MIIKKGWFSELEILQMRQKVNRKSRSQDPNTVIGTPKTEKRGPSNRNKPQSNENRNNTHPNLTEQALTQEKEMITENIKKIVWQED